MERRDLECYIFVDSDLDEARFIGLVMYLTGGIYRHGSIPADFADHCGIAYEKNHNYDPAKTSYGEFAYDYYKYTLDMAPADNIAEDAYVAKIKELAHKLEEYGCKVYVRAEFMNR